MDGATRNYPTGDLRVSDADRDRALAELNEAFQAGRITAGEFDQRSGQAMGARTGKELTALLADLPPDRVPADITRPPQTRVVATRVAVAASAAAATAMAALALTNGLSNGPGNSDTPQHRQLAEEVLRSLHLNISLPPAPPAPGFDWAGTITPAAIAVLLIALIIVLRATRPGRNTAGT